MKAVTDDDVTDEAAGAARASMAEASKKRKAMERHQLQKENSAMAARVAAATAKTDDGNGLQ